MRVPFVIVICILVILGMVVEANAIARVHDEYRRRRWVQGQSASVKIHMNYQQECTMNIICDDDDEYPVNLLLKYLMYCLRENIDDSPLHVFERTFDNVSDAIYTYEYYQ